MGMSPNESEPDASANAGGPSQSHLDTIGPAWLRFPFGRSSIELHIHGTSKGTQTDEDSSERKPMPNGIVYCCNHNCRIAWDRCGCHQAHPVDSGQRLDFLLLVHQRAWPKQRPEECLYTHQWNAAHHR